MTTATQSCTNEKEIRFSWKQFSPVPDEVGFAGSYAGVSNGHLIVAGGSNFPVNTRPWSGGIKFWSDKVFAFEKETNQWKEAGRLPRPMGYGVSVNWQDGIILAGGADQQQHYADVYYLRYINGALQTDTLPSLPEPNANACGALIGDILYIAGGLDAPAAKTTKKSFWSLDLSKPAAERAWQVLNTWPGEARMLGVAGALNNEFYLISGVSLRVPTDDTAAHRQYLKDAYKYAPSTGWQRINDLPHPVVAAPGPAFAYHNKQLLVFGGDDGSRAEQNAILKDKHPGFRTEILAYDAATDQWNISGNILTDKQPEPENNPNASVWAPVTTPLVVWDNEIILPGGEVRPGVRTNRVLVAQPK